jgi:hypothetical protein
MNSPAWTRGMSCTRGISVDELTDNCAKNPRKWISTLIGQHWWPDDPPIILPWHQYWYEDLIPLEPTCCSVNINLLFSMQLIWTVVGVVVVAIVALLVVYITCYFCMRRINTNLPFRNIENDCHPDSLQSMQFHSRNQIFHIHGRQDLDPPPSYEQVMQSPSTSVLTLWQNII